MQIRLKLKDILDKNHMTQKEFAEVSGLYPSVVSALCRNSGTSVNYNYMEKIAEVFNITDIKEILELQQ